MSTKLINKIWVVVMLAAGAAACKKEMLPEQERLFRPVLKGNLQSEGNYINVAWERMTGAVSYTLEISRDTFKTIERSITIDSARYTFENLQWDKMYRLQVRSNAADSAKNSRFSYLGEIKTPRFPTILNLPGISDILPTKVRVTWITGGAPVTTIKILKASDSSLVKETPLDAADVAANFKIVSGLSPATPYIIFLYSGTSVRGWADFTTSDQLSGNIIDLTDILDRPGVLLDTLPVIANGSIVLLKKGQVYTINSSLALTRSVTITSGDDLLITTPPVLHFTSNFTIAASATVDYVRFEKLSMRSDNYAGRYVFNVNSPCNVGEISFSNCMMGAFRGVTRFQNQNITVEKFLINDCVVDSIKDYGVINADGAMALVKQIGITNSTFYKCERIITSTKPTGTLTSITVENCTFNESPLGGAGTGTGNALIDCSNQTFTGVITFKNNIIGPGLLRDNVIVRGIRPGGGPIVASNNYATADAVFAADPVPDITAYAKPATELFTSPATGNFKIKDNTFAGRNTAGDPRWRP